VFFDSLYVFVLSRCDCHSNSVHGVTDVFTVFTFYSVKRLVSIVILWQIVYASNSVVVVVVVVVVVCV